VKSRLLVIATAVAALMASALMSASQAYADNGPYETATVANVNGNGEQFWIGGDCHLYHSYQSYPGGPYGPAYSLGGCLKDFFPYGDLDVGMNADGRLEVFAIGTDNSVWHIWQTRAGSGPWSNWASLGGTATSGPWTWSRLSGYSDMYVYVVGADGNYWERHQTSPGCCWSNWQRG
jgi:hypothetical protein